MKILLAEDDEMIGESLSKGLKQDGYTVNWVKTVKQQKSRLNPKHMLFCSFLWNRESNYKNRQMILFPDNTLADLTLLFVVECYLNA